MYDCQKTRDLLGLYIDNELEAALTQGVATHLEQCVSCRRELETFRSQNEVLARAIKGVAYDTTNLRSLIEAGTIRKYSVQFRNLSFLRVPAWAVVGVLVLMLSAAGLFYLPGRFSVTLAHPVYQAAVKDHLGCSTESSAPDWITSQPAIAEKARPFLHNKMSPPLVVSLDYKLVRARLCQLNGETFLHLVYETADGRQASLFLCSPAQLLPNGQRQFRLSGNSVQSSDVSGIRIASMLKGDCLLIAAAGEDGVPAAILSLLMS